MKKQQNETLASLKTLNVYHKSHKGKIEIYLQRAPSGSSSSSSFCTTSNHLIVRQSDAWVLSENETQQQRASLDDFDVVQSILDCKR